MKALVTAGPTREYIDDIRFISNPSSGKMGLEIARALDDAGFEVCLVIGPNNLKLDISSRVVDVTSADEMTDEAIKELSKGYDVLVSCAAIADFTVDRFKGKIRSGKSRSLELKPTRKLIREARDRFPNLVIVAFKAESSGSNDEMTDKAKTLLDTADLVVLNDVGGEVFGSDKNEVYIIGKDTEHIGRMDKAYIAKRIVEYLQ